MIRMETDTARVHVVTYVHAHILEPAPNVSHLQPRDRGSFAYGLRNALLFGAAGGFLIWLCYHLFHS